jgi:hypothetical protein
MFDLFQDGPFGPAGWTNVDLGHIADPKRHVVVHFNNGQLDILQVFDITKSPYDIFHLVDLHRICTDVEVGLSHGFHDFHQAHIVGFHGFWVQIHLVFLDMTANTCHLGYPSGSGKTISNVEILYGTQLVQIPAPGGVTFLIAAFERIEINLPQTCGIRAQLRLYPFGQ